MKLSTRRGRLGAISVLALGVALVASAVAMASPSGASKSASLVIHHQLHGCHAWSLNHGPLVVKQRVNLKRGGFLTLTNNDVMAQELIKKSGPAVKMRLLGQAGKSQVIEGEGMGKAGPYTLSHMGARLRVSFPKAGTYRFGLMDRGDYSEVKVIGDDNELKLTVVVS